MPRPLGDPVADQQEISLDYEGAVAVITIDRPPLNLVTVEMRRRLHDLLRGIADDDDVRALVIRSEGEKAFSVGSDVREFPDDSDGGRARAEDEHACYDTLERLPQPTIAALSGGHVLGGGLELALACDLRVAQADARLGLPEIGLGIFPGGGGTQRLPRLVGAAKAKEMILLGQTVSAEEAHALGLVNRVVAPGEVDATARELAAELAGRPRLAVQAAKRAIDAGLMLGPADGQQAEIEQFARLFGTYDQQEGLDAFFEKRAPRFEHR